MYFNDRDYHSTTVLLFYWTALYILPRKCLINFNELKCMCEHTVVSVNQFNWREFILKIDSYWTHAYRKCYCSKSMIRSQFHCLIFISFPMKKNKVFIDILTDLNYNLFFSSPTSFYTNAVIHHFSHFIYK